MSMAKFIAFTQPLPPLANFNTTCNPKKMPKNAEQLRADCLAVAKRLALDADREINRLVGIRAVRRLAAGTPLADEMRALHARFIYLHEKVVELEAGEFFGYTLAQTLAAMREGGELAFFERKLAHFGVPTNPPASWKTQYPDELMLPEERLVLKRL